MTSTSQSQSQSQTRQRQRQRHLYLNARALEQQTENFVRRYFALHGYAPSVREIAEYLGDGVNSRSTSLVKDVLRRLRERNRIVGAPDGKARAFTLPELMEAARALVTTTSDE